MFIRNWRLNLLAIVFITLFFSLSYWQHERAQEKEKKLAIFKARSLTIFNAREFLQSKDPLYYQVKLTGQFDHSHTILLDNKTFQGKIGYEIYTPFHIDNSNQTILVDRGFVAISGDRNTKPMIAYANEKELQGVINFPLRYRQQGKMITDNQLNPLIRVEYIDINALSKIMGYSLLPYVLQTEVNLLSTIPPEKHLAYSFQWFALGLTLLVLLVALNLRKTS